MKNSFVMYSNWATMIDKLPREQAGELSQAICHYFLTGEVMEMDPIIDAIFYSILPIMDEDNRKYEEKVDRINAINEKKTDKNEVVTKSERSRDEVVTKSLRSRDDIVGVNDNVNVNDTVSSYEDIKDNVGQPDAVAQIVDYLNEKTQSNFKAKTESTKKHIEARLKEGYSVDDFKKVIDAQVADWGDSEKMRKYLRPQTLFIPANFEAYLNEANRPRPTPEPKGNTFNNFPQNTYDFDELERRLTLNM